MTTMKKIILALMVLSLTQCERLNNMNNQYRWNIETTVDSGY